MFSSNNRRTRKLIEPYKQLRFGIVFLILNFLFSTVMIGVFAYFLWDVYGAVTVYFNLDSEQNVVVAKKFLYPLSINLIVYLAFIFSTLYLSVRFTHQFYGPLVSIRRFFDELIAGKNPSPIRLRSSDQLHDVVDKINTFAQAPTSSPSNIEALIRCVDQALEGAEVQLPTLDEKDPLKPLAMKIMQVSAKINSLKS